MTPQDIDPIKATASGSLARAEGANATLPLQV